jgi:hypothetical protein
VPPEKTKDRPAIGNLQSEIHPRQSEIHNPKPEIACLPPAGSYPAAKAAGSLSVAASPRCAYLSETSGRPPRGLN